MKKILVAFVSRTGKTEKMAEYIAEGVRFCGHGVEVLRTEKIIPQGRPPEVTRGRSG